jgi:hypothetical protein
MGSFKILSASCELDRVSDEVGRVTNDLFTKANLLGQMSDALSVRRL